MCTHIYVRNSFEKEYNSILDKEIKSTSIFLFFFFFEMCILGIIGFQALSSYVVYVYADKRNRNVS